MLFFIPFLRVRSHYCLFYEFSKLLGQESRFGKLAIVSLRLLYDIVFSVNSSDSGMSGTRRHIRLCHYTPGHRPSNGRVRTFPACLLNIDYVIRRNLSCLRIIHDVRFHTCIARLAPSVVDNMYRQALLRWMIQFFSDTDILNRRVDNIDTVRWALLQSQNWTTLQQSDLATPHTVSGALGKPTRHTWRRGAL